MTPDELRCQNCHAPSVRLQRRDGYDCCDDCADLADSPFYTRNVVAHAFVYTSGAPGICFDCGRGRDNTEYHLPAVARPLEWPNHNTGEQE